MLLLSVGAWLMRSSIIIWDLKLEVQRIRTMTNDQREVSLQLASEGLQRLSQLVE